MTDLPDSPAPATADEGHASGPIPFAVGSHATYRGKRVELTLVHDDQTADVQEIDKNGEPVLDENKQPKWTPKVPLGDLV